MPDTRSAHIFAPPARRHLAALGLISGLLSGSSGAGLELAGAAAAGSAILSGSRHAADRLLLRRRDGDRHGRFGRASRGRRLVVVTTIYAWSAAIHTAIRLQRNTGDDAHLIAASLCAGAVGSRPDALGLRAVRSRPAPPLVAHRADLRRRRRRRHAVLSGRAQVRRRAAAVLRLAAGGGLLHRPRSAARRARAREAYLRSTSPQRRRPCRAAPRTGRHCAAHAALPPFRLSRRSGRRGRSACRWRSCAPEGWPSPRPACSAPGSRPVLDGELDLQRCGAAEQLHGDELGVAIGRAHHGDADLRHVRPEHVGAVAGRGLPALDGIAGELPGLEAAAVEVERQVLRHRAIAIALRLGALRRAGGRPPRARTCRSCRGSRQRRARPPSAPRSASARRACSPCGTRSSSRRWRSRSAAGRGAWPWRLN